MAPACPACSGKLTALSTGNNDAVLCPQCLAYCEGQAGKLWSTDPARVAQVIREAMEAARPRLDAVRLVWRMA